MLQITMKAARVNARLKIKEAAEEIGVTAEILRNYERGRTVIPAHVLKKAAIIYRIPEENIHPNIINDGEYHETKKNLQTFTV